MKCTLLGQRFRSQLSVRMAGCKLPAAPTHSVHFLPGSARAALYSCASLLHEIQKISLDPFLLLQLMWLQKSDLLTIGFTFPQCLWASFPHTARLCWAPSEPKGVHALGLLHLELAKPSMVARHKRKQPQLCTSSSTVSLHCKWTKRHKSSSRCILSFWIV